MTPARPGRWSTGRWSTGRWSTGTRSSGRWSVGGWSRREDPRPELPEDPSPSDGPGRFRARSRYRNMTFRTRVGTLVAAAVGVTVAVAALASYFTVRHQLYSQVDSTLLSEIRTTSAPSAQGIIDPERMGLLLRRTENGLLQVIDSNGNVNYSSVTALNPTAPAMRPTAGQVAVASAGADYRIDTVRYENTAYRVITEGGFFEIGATGNRTPAAIQIGRPLADIYHTLGILRLILWLVSLGGIAVAVALGYLIGRTTIRPVERLTRAAEHVAATQDLGSTIEADGDDELARLARAFNSMLVALAASRDQQAQLISDAGHELRTPLTSLRTNIEVLMRTRDLPDADRRELMDDVEAQLEELTTLIGDVVDLARQEEQQPEPIEVRLDSMVTRAVERARRRATGLVFDVHLTPGSVRAQPALLERAILNVLDNAAKWSPPGGTVEVWLHRGTHWSLDVHDHGPGIAPEDLPHVFDRFYRAASARSMPGSGLGLAIVSQVIGQHGGRVEASMPPGGGTLVHIELPTVVESEPTSEEVRDKGADGALSDPELPAYPLTGR